jgi:hypothetical protein
MDTQAVKEGGRFMGTLRARGDALLQRLDPTRMSKHDRDRWSSVRDMDGLGETVIAWLHGEVTRTPAHAGPPDDETYPLIPALEVINRGGFVTDNSQLAETCGGSSWNTWVCGFASDATLERLREAVAGMPLVLGACRGRVHGCRPRRAWLQPCPRRDATDFWADACPRAADALWRTWWIHIEDPQPGRNDLLWVTLANALRGDH